MTTTLIGKATSWISLASLRGTEPATQAMSRSASRDFLFQRSTPNATSATVCGRVTTYG
jgi:hypothetical protein